MTGRAWILLLAAAVVGVCTALLWPSGGPEMALQVPDRALVEADVAILERVCKQLADDRNAVRITLDRGQPMVAFASRAARNPSSIADSCARADSSIEEFLAITAALGRARRYAARATRWEAEFERRAEARDVLADVAELAALTAPPVAPEPDPDALPADLAALPAAERANLDLYRTHVDRVATAWTALMGPPPGTAEAPSDDE